MTDPNANGAGRGSDNRDARPQRNRNRPIRYDPYMENSRPQVGGHQRRSMRPSVSLTTLNEQPMEQEQVLNRSMQDVLDAAAAARNNPPVVAAAASMQAKRDRAIAARRKLRERMRRAGKSEHEIELFITSLSSHALLKAANEPTPEPPRAESRLRPPTDASTPNVPLIQVAQVPLPTDEQGDDEDEPELAAAAAAPPAWEWDADMLHPDDGRVRSRGEDSNQSEIFFNALMADQPEMEEVTLGRYALHTPHGDLSTHEIGHLGNRRKLDFVELEPGEETELLSAAFLHLPIRYMDDHFRRRFLTYCQHRGAYIRHADITVMFMQEFMMIWTCEMQDKVETQLRQVDNAASGRRDLKNQVRNLKAELRDAQQGESTATQLNECQMMQLNNMVNELAHERQAHEILQQGLEEERTALIAEVNRGQFIINQGQERLRQLGNQLDEYRNRPAPPPTVQQVRTEGEGLPLSTATANRYIAAMDELKMQLQIEREAKDRAQIQTEQDKGDLAELRTQFDGCERQCQQMQKDLEKIQRDTTYQTGVETERLNRKKAELNIRQQQLEAAVQGMLPLKHQLHTRFPTSAQTKAIAARSEHQGFLTQTGFRFKPTEVQLDIAVRATICLGEGRQPIINIEGPAGNGKTVSMGHCLYCVINYFRIRYPKGYPLRHNCNPKYKEDGPLIKLSTMAALVIATTNYAIEHAALQFYTDLVAPPKAIEGYSYFDKPTKGKFHFLRHIGTNKKAMDSEVSHATQYMIAMYHDSPNTPERVTEIRALLQRNDRKVKELLNGLPEKQKKEDQKEANQDVQEAQKLCAQNKDMAMEMWDLVMEHCSIDAVFVTAALLVDVRLKHPNLNFHTLFVEESSQMHISHLLMGIELLSTKIPDPCVILYGDKHQMPVMTKTTARAKAISDLGILGILTNPAAEIARAMGYSRGIWDDLHIPDPLPVTDVHHLDVQHRMTEPLCRFVRHNVYINDHFRPTFDLHESLTDPPHKSYSSKPERRARQHMADRIPDPKVIKIVNSSAKRFSCAHLPQLRLGHQLWNINVTEGMEKTDTTSKTHDVMTKLCLKMLELQLWYRKAFPGEDVTVITYYDTQRQDMLRGLQALHTKYGKFRTLRYHQPLSDKDGNLLKDGGFEKLETSFLDVKVVNLATIQGKENKVIYVLIPRMLSVPKIKRLHAAEVYLQPRSKWETAENVPIINFEALKRLPQLVHNFLGFVADANKTTVALTRATQMLFVLQNFHTTDLDPLWNQFNQMTHNLGLTTTHPLQVYQDAYAHSDVPDDWYWEDERCMHKPRMLPGRERNIKPIKLTEQVNTCGVVDVDRDELLCPASYSNNFYRKPMNTSYCALKEGDHDCTKPQLPQIRPPHVKYVRKDVGRIKAENPRLYKLWLRTISKEEQYEQGTMRLNDDLNETELYAAEDVAAFRLQQANQTRERMEEEDRKDASAAKEYQERMFMEVASKEGPKLLEFYTEYIPKGVSPEQRKLRIMAGDLLYEPPADTEMPEEPEEGQVSDEEDELEERVGDKSIEEMVEEAKLHKTQYNAIIRDFKAFRWLEGVYSSPLFQNLITLYKRHQAEFTGMDLKLPGNWAELEDESLFDECADSEANAAFLTAVRQTELTDERHRSHKFQLLTFEAIRYSTQYRDLNLKHAKQVEQMLALPNHRYNCQGELHMMREGMTPTVFTGPYLDDDDATEFNLIAEFETAVEPSLDELNGAMPALAGDDEGMGDVGEGEAPAAEAEAAAQAQELARNVVALQQQLEPDAQQQIADDAAKFVKKEAPNGEGN